MAARIREHGSGKEEANTKDQLKRRQKLGLDKARLKQRRIF